MPHISWSYTMRDRIQCITAYCGRHQHCSDYSAQNKILDYKMPTSFIAAYPLLGPLGINHGTTAPTISQNKVTMGKATAKDVFTIFFTVLLFADEIEI